MTLILTLTVIPTPDRNPNADLNVDRDRDADLRSQRGHRAQAGADRTSDEKEAAQRGWHDHADQHDLHGLQSRGKLQVLCSIAKHASR